MYISGMIAIYCRTSKNKEEDYSIPTQKEGGIKFADEVSENYQIYVDEGISGTKGEEARMGFAQMITDIKRGKISAVYCIDQSRIERNSNIWRFFVGECLNNNCKYFPNGKELDLKDPDSMLFADLLSLVNSYYAALTSKKVKLANYKKAQEGKTHGLKAYGYRRNKENRFEIYEEEAKYVREMFKMSLDGMGTYSIAKEFNNMKVPTKFNRFKGKIKRLDKYTQKESYYNKSEVKWRGNVIYDMLKNEIYKGIRVWDDLRIEMPEIAIIPTELWDKVNANLIKNKKNVGKKASYNYLLNGLIRCGHCGNEVLGKKRPKGNDNAYKCKSKRPPHSNCAKSRGISLPKLETFIIHHLFHSKELKKLLIEAPKNDSEISRLQLKLDGLKEKLQNQTMIHNRFIKALKNPDLKDDDTILKEYVNSKNEIKTLSDWIYDIEIKLTELKNTSRNQRTKRLIESYTDKISFDDLKRIIHSLIETIEIYHNKEGHSGFYTVKLKYRNYSEESLFTTNWTALKWIWITRYRNSAITNDDLQDDINTMQGLYEYYGINEQVAKDFKGFEMVESKYEILELKRDELFQSN